MQHKPSKGREPDSPERAAREAKAAQEHKEHKMKILKTASRDREYRHLVELDGMGEPTWKEEKYGQFVVMATRIDKATGGEVGNVLDGAPTRWQRSSWTILREHT
jgi:hypothetical protein